MFGTHDEVREHRERLAARLRALGYTVKLAGG